MSPRAPPLVAALLAAALLAGCSTRRTLVLESAPGGATVWVNGVKRGATPVTVPFVHPGTWNVRMEKPGFASLAQDVGVASGFADLPVVDLPFELLVPGRQWRWTGRLEPLPPTPDAAGLEEVLDRARGFREQTYRAVDEPGTPRRSAK